MHRIKDVAMGCALRMSWHAERAELCSQLWKHATKPDANTHTDETMTSCAAHDHDHVTRPCFYGRRNEGHLDGSQMTAREHQSQ
eukprot:scaffold223189_cov18-Tisochrysis_lutea.AAC.1